MSIKRRIRRGQRGDKAIILLHGYGASMDDLFPLADYIDPKREYDCIFPNAPIEVTIGPHMTGAAWFPLNMQEIERAMMTGSYRSYVDEKPAEFDSALERITADLKDLANNYDQLLLGGFSQGGMVASHLAMKSIIPAKKMILLSTTLVGKSELELAINGTANFAPVFLSHGLNDPVLSPAIAKEFVAFLQKYNFDVTTEFFVGGHEIPLSVIEKLRSFIQKP